MEVAADDPADLMLAAYERAYDNGWTDGLPIIPATDRRVDEFVRASGRAADEVIGLIPPRKGRVTTEVVAVNAVMAGCRPEYMPVIIAALEGLLDPGFPLELMQMTTNPMTPLLLINGPIRKELDINSGTGCLGPGWRANSTIGRAIRLLLINGGSALPGVFSKVSFGSPLRYSYLCGENEEENPWEPFHLGRGFKREDSTVTVFKASNYCNISGGEGVGPVETLRHIASHMPPMYGGGDGALLFLGVNHARSLYDAGLSKRDIQHSIWQFARAPVENYAKSFVETERGAGRADDRMVWRTRSPDDVFLAVGGGAGPQDLYISAGAPKTRLIKR